MTLNILEFFWLYCMSDKLWLYERFPKSGKWIGVKNGFKKIGFYAKARKNISGDIKMCNPASCGNHRPRFHND